MKYLFENKSSRNKHYNCLLAPKSNLHIDSATSKKKVEVNATKVQKGSYNILEILFPLGHFRTDSPRDRDVVMVLKVEGHKVPKLFCALFI